MVRNIHERVVAAAPDDVGALLDTLGSAGDRLWPLPPRRPMVLRHSDGGGLAVGARGGHGGVRYTVAEWQPGHRVVFRFDPRMGLDGWHGFEVLPRADGTTLLRHTLQAQPRHVMRLLWPLVVRSMHDCYAEDALDRAEYELGVGPATGHRHSGPIRWFERRLRRRVTSTAPVLDGLGADAVPRADAADAFRTDLLPGDGTDPVAWSGSVFAASPAWVDALMRLRHALVRPFGLRTGPDTGEAGAGARAGHRHERGLFPVLASSSTEALMGVDDKHLDFRVVTTVDEQRRSVTMTTIVYVHSRFGRFYWSVVRFFHPRVVRALMRRAAHPAGTDVTFPPPAGAATPRDSAAAAPR